MTRDWRRVINPARWSVRTRVIVGLTLAVCLPLVVGLIALSRTHWYPVLDLAMTELRVRDVGTRHTPLIGLPGRIGLASQPQGSHPGPLSFYLLAPTYKLLGSTAWSLELGTVLIHAAAVVAVLVLAYRRGGARLALVAGAMLAVVLRGYGADVLTQPWNPYLPVIAWLVVLLAVWSLLEGDAVAIVFFVVAGTFCAQTHVPYVALVGGLGVLTLVWLVVRQRVTRLGQQVPMPGVKRWSIVAGVAMVVMWLPPVADQIRHSPGNLRELYDYFKNPPDQAIGGRAGFHLLLEHLNVFRVIGAAFHNSDYFKSIALTLPSSGIPGFVFLVMWIACVVQAWRLRHRTLIHLHAVVGASLLLGFVAMERIFGIVWYYLTFWAWGDLALMVVAVAWTVAVTVRRTKPALDERVERAVRLASIAVLAASTLSFSYSAAHVKPPENYLSVSLGSVVEQTARALADGTGGATGHAGRYLATVHDVAYFNSQFYGFVSEMERRGFDVGVEPGPLIPVGMTQHRVLPSGTATAELHFATGAAIAEWTSKPGATEIAQYHPPAANVARYAVLRQQVQAMFTALGQPQLAAEVDTNLFATQLAPETPRSIQRLIDQMLQLGQDTAVFIAPLTP